MTPFIIYPSSFHDCVRYTEGGGGCDGCLNWHGVGHRFRGNEKLKYKVDAVIVSESIYL